MGFMAAFVISEWLNLVRSRDAVDPAGYSGLFFIYGAVAHLKQDIRPNMPKVIFKHGPETS